MCTFADFDLSGGQVGLCSMVFAGLMAPLRQGISDRNCCSSYGNIEWVDLKEDPGAPPMGGVLPWPAQAQYGAVGQPIVATVTGFYYDSSNVYHDILIEIDVERDAFVSP